MEKKFNFCFTILLSFTLVAIPQNKIFMNRENKSIQISDSISLYQEIQTEGKNTQWKLWLAKKGENIVKIQLDSQIISSQSFQTSIGQSDEGETALFIPELIDAFKENHSLYVFLYKNRNVILKIFKYIEGVKYECEEYKLIPIGGGSITNFGSYNILINRKKIDSFYYIDIRASRKVLFSKEILFSIDPFLNIIREIDFKTTENSQTINAPFSIDNTTYPEDVKIKLIEIIPKAKNTDVEYLGYMDDLQAKEDNDLGYSYVFYRTFNPVKINVIRIDNYNKIWLVNGDMAKIIHKKRN